MAHLESEDGLADARVAKKNREDHQRHVHERQDEQVALDASLAHELRLSQQGLIHERFKVIAARDIIEEVAHRAHGGDTHAEHAEERAALARLGLRH